MLNLLFAVSPVVYGLRAVQWPYRVFFTINPLAGLLEAFRWSLLRTAPPPLFSLLYAAVASAVIFAAGAYSFKRMERKFADVI